MVAAPSLGCSDPPPSGFTQNSGGSTYWYLGINPWRTHSWYTSKCQEYGGWVAVINGSKELHDEVKAAVREYLE